MQKKIIRIALPVFLAAFSFQNAWAITAGDTEQSRRELITQTDLLKKKSDGYIAPAKKPEVEQQEEKPQTLPAGPVFLVKKIVLEGCTLFPLSDFDALFAAFEGKKLSFRDLEKITGLISDYYLQHGYATSRAYIPPQKVTDEGIVRIAVIEGRVGEVKVKGNRWFRDTLYRNALKFSGGDFFEMAGLETALREINQQPDRAVKAYLEPGEKPGTTDIVLGAQDQFPVHLSYEFNRRGTKLTHRSRHVLHLTDNNLLGFGDQLESSLSLGEQNSILGGAFTYELPIQSTGTVFSLAAAAAESHLQGNLRQFHVKGKSSSLVPGLRQELIRTQNFELDGALRFELKDSRTLAGDEQLSNDRNRVVVIGPHAAYYDRWGQTFGSADLHVGIPHFMGGSSKRDGAASRLESGGQFVYGTASIARLHRLPYQSMLVLQTAGQYSPVPLNSLEQMDLGGMYSVRGYPENDSVGDYGYSFSSELRVPPYFIPAKWPVPGMKDKRLRDTLSLVTFVEGGQAFNYKRQRASSEKNRTLLGTGFGVRFNLSPDCNIQFDYGIPFGDTSSDKDNPQIHLSARIGY